jgi:hypothetical protein
VKLEGKARAPADVLDQGAGGENAVRNLIDGKVFIDFCLKGVYTIPISNLFRYYASTYRLHITIIEFGSLARALEEAPDLFAITVLVHHDGLSYASIVSSKYLTIHIISIHV